VDEKLVAFIRSLRPKYRTGMISNAWSELRPWLKELRIADAFDHIVISSEVGLAKPDPRIFQLALDDLGISPQEAVFIDDFEVNIEAAGEIGMHAILFRNTEQTIAEIRSILGLNSYD